MSVVTRFPPSPTGFMHIGNARTALFNWLYARHHGGKMLFRIEDTDRARHSEDAVEAIKKGVEWLGLDWDGDVVSQFSRIDRHTEVAEALLEKGQAYRCYCTEEELAEMRETAKKEGRSTFYDRRWRDRPDDEAPKDAKFVVRIKAPLEGKMIIEDKVQGKIKINNKELDDFIILRSDGTPTYMLSVVVDDHDMGVTHILRGDDHINNAFRQKVIFDAMGWDVPVYGHLPLIHGPDGAKFSKRHGATSVEEYRDMGYLPEAMRNYLLRLGWSHGNDEMISTEQAVEWFDFDGIGKSAARFDFKKLDNMNGHYIGEADNERLYTLIHPLLEENQDLNLDEEARKRIMLCMDELKKRAKTLVQLSDEASFLAKVVPFDFDEKAEALLDQNAHELLLDIKEAFEKAEEFTHITIQDICKAFADEKMEGKLGKVAMPLRAALTGTTVSPSIFHAAEILGKEEVINRINAALERIG